MSVAKRIIPCLDVDKGRVVKGINFVDIVDAGDPVEIAKKYDKEGADEITFLDITASHEGRDNILGVVEQVANEVFIPLTVGGGVKSFSDVRDLLSAGADKVTINTAAVANPDLINEVTDKIGRQCIVVAVDIKKSKEQYPYSCPASDPYPYPYVCVAVCLGPQSPVVSFGAWKSYGTIWGKLWIKILFLRWFLQIFQKDGTIECSF